MVFATIVIGVLVLMHLYVYRRAVHDLFEAPRARKAGAAVLAVLLGATVAAFVTRRTPAVPVVLPYVGYVWVGVLLYLVLLLAAGEVVRLAAWRFDGGRRRFLSRVLAGTAVVGAVGTIGFGAVAARQVRVERREVLLDRLDPAFDGFTVAAISDVHLGPFMDGTGLARLVATINEAGPDAVAVVGDLVDGGVADLGAAAEPLRDLVAPAYFVTGNHEYFSDAADWVAYLPTLGVRVLRNERVEIRRPRPARAPAVLYLAGCDDRTAAGSGVPGHGFDLDAALRGRDPAIPVVLLCHQPVMVEHAAHAGVDLQISGHTHGGQLWPITHLALLDQPVLAGLVRVGPTWLYVTRGVGFWGPPARVGSPPEITLLTLRAPAGSR